MTPAIDHIGLSVVAGGAHVIGPDLAEVSPTGPTRLTNGLLTYRCLDSAGEAGWRDLAAEIPVDGGFSSSGGAKYLSDTIAAAAEAA